MAPTFIFKKIKEEKESISAHTCTCKTCINAICKCKQNSKIVFLSLKAASSDVWLQIYHLTVVLSMHD